MSESVRLVNLDDQFVADVYISTLNLPVDVVLWEDKAFIYRDDEHGFRVYREATIWSVVEEAIIKRRHP